MRVIRHHVFETNSSSCHSIIKLNKALWEKFENNQIFLKRNMFRYEEHMTISDEITEENSSEYFTDLDTEWKKLQEAIKERPEPDRWYTSSAVYYYNRRFEWFKSIITKELFYDYLCDDLGKHTEIIKVFQEPLVVDWHSGSSTYTEFNAADIEAVISELDYDVPETISDYNWENYEITNGKTVEYSLSYTGNIDTITLENKTENIIVSVDKDNKKISLKDLGLETITVEREVNC